MKQYLSLIIVLSVFLGQTAMADFYQWIDQNGKTQITDYPPPQDVIVKDVQIQKSQPVDKQTSNKADESSKAKAKEKTNVVLYTKNNCPECDKARYFLRTKNISFTEYNMDTDENAADKRKEFDDGEDVPFAIVDKSQIYGFSENIYKKVLKTD